MHRAFSFAMAAERSRYKERLEATLAGLCELEMLKQRQESLVLSALSLGDSGPGCARAAWPLIRHCFPSSSNLELEQPGSAEQQVKVIRFRQRAHFCLERRGNGNRSNWIAWICRSSASFYFLQCRNICISGLATLTVTAVSLLLASGWRSDFSRVLWMVNGCSFVKQFSIAPFSFTRFFPL